MSEILEDGQILNDVIGYFSPNEEVLTDDGEKARGFIAKSFTMTLSLVM